MEGTRSTALTATDVPAHLLDAFDAALRGAVATASFAECEAAALRLQNAVVRAWLQRQLAAREQTFTPEITVDGARYRRHQLGVGSYHSLCGTLEVPRHTYRRVGVHNGPTVVPLELSAGLVERATPAFAFAVAQGFAAMPLRHFEAELRAAHREPPSRSTMERLAKRLGDGLRAALPQIEPLVREEQRVGSAGAISIGLDRTCAPMAEPRSADQPSTPRRPRRQPYRRQPPPPIDVNYRMPYVGTIAVHGNDGAVLSTTRVAASAGEGQSELIARLFDEVAVARRRHPRAPFVVVQDGAPELWRLVREGCRTHEVRPTLEMIDRFHVDERLAAVAEAICGTSPRREQLRRRWMQQLDRSDTSIDRIRRELRGLWWHFLDPSENSLPTSLARFVEHHIPVARQRVIAQHLEYLDNHRRRMRWASARGRGLPIGSGVTEGACKSVVGMRCKRSGQRWGERGLSRCLTLRTLYLDDRLRPCFEHPQATYTRDVGLL